MALALPLGLFASIMTNDVWRFTWPAAGVSDVVCSTYSDKQRQAFESGAYLSNTRGGQRRYLQFDYASR